jgi:hypothetical protein
MVVFTFFKISLTKQMSLNTWTFQEIEWSHPNVNVGGVAGWGIPNENGEDENERAEDAAGASRNNDVGAGG